MRRTEETALSKTCPYCKSQVEWNLGVEFGKYACGSLVAAGEFFPSEVCLRDVIIARTWDLLQAVELGNVKRFRELTRELREMRDSLKS